MKYLEEDLFFQQGDSGGPLICNENGRWIQAGVLSFATRGCGKRNGVGGYIKVSHYRDWIDEWMAKM